MINQVPVQLNEKQQEVNQEEDKHLTVKLMELHNHFANVMHNTLFSELTDGVIEQSSRDIMIIIQIIYQLISDYHQDQKERYQKDVDVKSKEYLDNFERQMKVQQLQVNPNVNIEASNSLALNRNRDNQQPHQQ